MAADPRPTSASAAPLVRVSWFDRALIGLAPGWGLRRVRARAAASMMARHYDSGQASRRSEGWRRSASDATASVVPALKFLREQSRDLLRNNGWARNGRRTIVDNTVGWGIEGKPVGASETVTKQAAGIWKKWSESTACDFDGRLSFTGLQALALRTIVESGEVIVVKETANSADNLPVPLRIRILEPDFIDTSKLRTRNDIVTENSIHNGIELDGRGRRVAYWLFDRHPGSSFGFTTTASRRIEAANVLHAYEVERPGQMRGAPWFASAIARLQDFDDYEDAILMQQKIAACFAAFVTDNDGSATAVGEQSKTDALIETFEPGQVQYLKQGEEITFATPPNVANQDVFSTANLRRIAASIGVTYEDLTGDYSKVNFSSSRMARIAHWQHVFDWQWNMVIPQLLDPVWRWVMLDAQAINGWPEVPTAEWTTVPMPLIDPVKEGTAFTNLVRSGLMTLPQAIRERGGDPAVHFEEIAKTNEKIDRLKLVLDTDPRKTSAAGLTQGRPPGTVNPDPGEPNEE